MSTCGTAHFLSAGQHGRDRQVPPGPHPFPKGASGAGRGHVPRLKRSPPLEPAAQNAHEPSTLWRWTANLFTRTAAREQKLGLILHGSTAANSGPMRFPGLSIRCSNVSPPAWNPRSREVYANDGQPLEKVRPGARITMLRGLSLGDVVLLPLYGLTGLFLIALGTAAVDAFRFYLLKTPVEKMLAAAGHGSMPRRKRRRVTSSSSGRRSSLEAKLATNTYRVGREIPYPDGLAGTDAGPS